MIVVFNEKGGVGKSNLSFTFAKDLNKPYITNDSSIVSSVYDNAHFTDKKLPVDPTAIYDLGGFLTRYITDILDQARIVVIPTIADYNAMLKAIKVIDYVGSDRAVVIANMIDKDKDFIEICEVIQESHPKVRILPLKRSKAFKNGLESGSSLRDLNDQSSLSKHAYRSVTDQYEKILKEITK